MALSLNVGIDLHKTQFTTCILLESEVLEHGTVYPTTNEGYASFLERVHYLSSKYYSSVNIAIESTANARFFREKMYECNANVTVVNTLKFKVVNLSTKKTDKNDAKTLAEFLSKEMLPTSHLCSAENEGLRRILKSRSLLVQNSVALKNQAHAVLLAFGRTTHAAQFQSKKSRQIILNSLPESIKTTISIMLNTLDILEIQIHEKEKKMRELTNNNKTIKLLQTIPGIGLVNAATIAAYIDDISRFENYKQFSSYCGLVPWVQTSNETVFYGRITKRGPAELRTAIVQCVVAMIRLDNGNESTSLMKQYKTLKQDKNSGKATIAIARKLSRIIFFVFAFYQKAIIQ